EASGRAIERARRLVTAIEASPARPLILSDASIPMDGAHRNALTLAFLIYSGHPGATRDVRLGRGPLTAGQSAIQASLLRPWLRAATSRIDFKDGSYEEDLVSGFSWWEAPFRWIGEQASLHLIAAPGDLVVTAYAPIEQLHRPIH